MRGQDAVFFPCGEGDDLTLLDPRQTRTKPDASPQYPDSRPWLESMLRKTLLSDR